MLTVQTAEFSVDCRHALLPAGRCAKPFAGLFFGLSEDGKSFIPIQVGRFLCPKRFEDYHFHAGRSFLMSIQVEILPGRLVGRISYSFSWLGCHSQTKATIAVPIQVGRFSYHHQLVGAFHTHPDIKNFISIQVGSFSKPYRKGDSCIHTGAKILISVQLGSLDYPYKWEDCCIHYR